MNRNTFIIALCLAALSAACKADSSNVRTVGTWGVGPSQAIACGSIDGHSYAFVGSGRLVMVLNVDIPAAPVKVSEIQMPDVPYGMVLRNSLLYVADGGAGMRVVDVSDSLHPTEVGYWDTPGSARGLFLSDTLCYVADDSVGGMRILNVSRPASPAEVGSLNTPGLARNLWVAGQYAYVADSFSLRVIDVNNPSMPTEAGSYATSDPVTDVVVDGIYAYLTGSGLRVLDISNPAQPECVQDCYRPTTTCKLVQQGGYLYIASRGDDLGIIDVTGPLRAHFEGRLFISGNGPANSVVVMNSLVYMAHTDGMRIIDVSNAASPTLTQHYRWPAQQVYYCAKAGAIVCCNGGYGDLFRVLDVADPHRPRELGTLQLGTYIDRVATDGNYAYITATDRQLLYVVDISNPHRPRLVGHIPPQNYSRDIVVHDGYAFISAGSYGGIVVCDIRNPSQPCFITNYSAYHTNCLTYADGLLYCAGYYGLNIFRIGEYGSLAFLGSYSLSEGVDIAVSGSCAYVTTWNQGVFIIDVNDPVRPTLAATFSRTGNNYTTYIAVEGPYAYLRESGLKVFNVSNPANVPQVGYYPVTGETREVLFSDGYLYVPKGYYGFGIYQGYGPAGVAEDNIPISKSQIPNASISANGNTIEYSLRQSGNVSLKLYNLLGQEVRSIWDGFRGSGSYVSRWDGKDESGWRAASGMYIVRLRTNSSAVHAKLVFVR